MAAATIRDATDADLPAILGIFNDAIVNTTTIWMLQPVDLENRRQWMASRHQASQPIFVADLEGRVVGYASYGGFRPYEGFGNTVEHSVFVSGEAQRRGIGTRLLAALFAHARAAGKHVMVACIEAGNAPSVRLHARLGFAETAYMPELGRKFGRWLDFLCMQKRLDDDDADQAAAEACALRLTACRAPSQCVALSEVATLQTVEQAQRVVLAIIRQPGGLGVHVGWKVAYPSQPSVRKFRPPEPTAFPVFSSALHRNPANLEAIRSRHSQWLEVGFALTVKADLELQEGMYSAADVERVVDGVSLVMVLVGSSYDYAVEATWPQALADPGAASAVVQGQVVALADAPGGWHDMPIVVRVNGTQQECASSPNHPFDAAARLADDLRHHHMRLRSGQLLLCGACTCLPLPPAGSTVELFI